MSILSRTNLNYLICVMIGMLFTLLILTLITIHFAIEPLPPQYIPMLTA